MSIAFREHPTQENDFKLEDTIGLPPRHRGPAWDEREVKGLPV